MTIGTLAQLAAIEGMPSEPSLRRFIIARDDFPMVTRGRYGLAYQFDLDVAVAFVRAHWIDGRRVATDRPQPIQLDLFNDEAER